MVDFLSFVVRSKRRVRLEFSSALAAGAFVPSWYTLETQDGATGDPVVVAALQVPGYAQSVELAIDRDLGPAGLYTLTIAAGVPAADASTAPQTVQSLAAPNPAPPPSEGLSASELLAILFQEDIAHDPVRGHLLAADGDLDVTTGPENAKATALRGAVSETLPHRDWGANLREVVDAPSGVLAAQRGKVQRQVRLDDRVLRSKVSVARDENDGDVILNIDLELIGQIKTNIREAL